MYIDIKELTPLPEWVAALCVAGKSRAVADNPKKPLKPLDQESTVTKAIKYLAQQAPAALQGDGGDHTTYKVAARVIGFGLSAETTWNLMLDHWNERCEPPWPADDLLTKVENAFSYRTGPLGEGADVDFEPVEILEPPKDSMQKKAKIFAVDFDEGADTALDYLADPLVEELLDQGATSTMYGDSNSRKTFVALDIAYHVATGKQWQGRDVAQGLVVYIAAEGGRGIRKRLAALKQQHGGGGVPFILIPCPVNMLDARSDMPQLLTLIQDAEERHGHKAKLVVIDTLSRALAGGDENASTDMGGFIRNVDALRSKTEAHVMVIHHTGKDQAKGARGWSGLRAAIDTEIEIAKGTISVTKQRDMDYGKPMKFTIDEIVLGKNAKGRDVTSCVVRILSGDDFIQIELTGEALEMFEAFCDCAKQQVLDRGEDLANWEKEPVNLANWENEYCSAKNDEGRYVHDSKEKLQTLQSCSARRPTARYMRTLRNNVVQSGTIREVSKNQWVKA